MSPRTQNPTFPKSLEHLCQAAETGRWSLVSAALFSSQPTINQRDISYEQESRLIAEALRQDEWSFLQNYVSLDFVEALETFETIVMAAAESGHFPFVEETLVRFQEVSYRPEWLLEILTVCVKNDRYLKEAMNIVPLLPMETSEEGLEDLFCRVQSLETDKAELKDGLLENIGSIQAHIVAKNSDCMRNVS